jgi:hypothetical protein
MHFPKECITSNPIKIRWKISSQCRNNRIRNIHLCTLGALAWKREGLHNRVNRSLALCVYFLDRCLSFFFWPLCCLSLFDLPILIIPLVSSNSSYLNSIPTFNQCQESLRSKFRRLRHLLLMLSQQQLLCLKSIPTIILCQWSLFWNFRKIDQ